MHGPTGAEQYTSLHESQKQSPARTASRMRSCVRRFELHCAVNCQGHGPQGAQPARAAPSVTQQVQRALQPARPMNCQTLAQPTRLINCRLQRSDQQSSRRLTRRPAAYQTTGGLPDDCCHHDVCRHERPLEVICKQQSARRLCARLLALWLVSRHCGASRASFRCQDE